MHIESFVLREIKEPVPVSLSTLGYRDFTGNADWKRNLISFTSLIYAPDRRSVICGMTAFDCDLMYEFQTDTGTFRNLGFQRWAEKFEIKIHRSLHRCRDGRIIGATACLHREDQRREARGGRIFIYDPADGSYDFLGIPVEHDYIQTITVDEDRNLIYGFTYPVFNFFVFDLKTRRNRRVDYMGSIPHLVTLAPDGSFFATWDNRTHNIFRYNPDSDEITYYHHNLPHTKASCGLMYPGAGPIDGMVTGVDGMLYIGEADGTLDRLNPASCDVVSLGRMVGEETRIPALANGADGRIYGIAGFLERCHLFAFDPSCGKVEDFGLIADSRDGTALYIGHDLVLADSRTAYIGETDTFKRAGRLWKCQF